MIPGVPEPVPVIPLDYAAPAETAAERRRRVALRIARACAPGAWLWALAAWGMVASGEVKTVLFTGPVLTAAGTAMLVAGAVARRPSFAALGAVHVALCVLLAVLVNVNRWGPSAARQPFTVIGGAYLVASTVATILVLAKTRPGAPGRD
jgi:hypothetical protein